LTVPGVDPAAYFNGGRALERRRHEVTVPRRSLQLVTARLLRLVLPGLLRFGMARTDPVPADVVERARARARAGKRLGDI
jgi:hypothetical protein